MNLIINSKSNYVLNFSDGIEEFGTINYKLLLALFACWLFIFLSLSKGVHSLGKLVFTINNFGIFRFLKNLNSLFIEYHILLRFFHMS